MCTVCVAAPIPMPSKNKIHSRRVFVLVEWFKFEWGSVNEGPPWFRHLFFCCWFPLSFCVVHQEVKAVCYFNYILFALFRQACIAWVFQWGETHCAWWSHNFNCPSLRQIREWWASTSLSLNAGVYLCQFMLEFIDFAAIRRGWEGQVCWWHHSHPWWLTSPLAPSEVVPACFPFVTFQPNPKSRKNRRFCWVLQVQKPRK